MAALTSLRSERTGAQHREVRIWVLMLSNNDRAQDSSSSPLKSILATAPCHGYHRQLLPKFRADVDFAKPSQGYRAPLDALLGGPTIQGQPGVNCMSYSRKGLDNKCPKKRDSDPRELEGRIRSIDSSMLRPPFIVDFHLRKEVKWQASHCIYS